MPITLGRESYYVGQLHEYFTPIIKVGNFTSIADEVTFCGKMNHACITHKKAVSSFPFTYQWKVDYFEESVSRGDINIGSDVYIGFDAFILDGVTIGDGVIIGAKTVVAKDVPPYAVVVGNPGVVKHYRFTSEQIEKLLQIKWWLWENNIIRQRMEDLKDIDKFIEKYGQ